MAATMVVAGGCGDEDSPPVALQETGRDVFEAGAAKHAGLPLPEGEEAASPQPRALLWLSPDGTVNRTAVMHDNGKALQWTILRDGTPVLEKNARNETQYRYFKQEPGAYTIYLEQFVDGAYRVISNVVPYRIE